MTAIREWWDQIWFRPASRASFIAMRVIIAGHALWILASRPDLPALTGWPAEFWKPLPRRLLLRFGYFGLHPSVEWALYVLALLLIVAVLLGFEIRVTAFAAGVLLYHFAPLDSLLAVGDFIGMGGLTVPTVAMFAIWAAWPAEGERSESSEYRWPVVLSQLLLALSFLLGGITKLTYVGWQWYGPSNIRQIALTTWSLSARPWALWIGSHSPAALMVGIGSAALDCLFVLAVFSRRVRWIVLPLAVIGSVVRWQAFGCHWLAMPLLLLFVNWDAVLSKVRDREG